MSIHNYVMQLKYTVDCCMQNVAEKVKLFTPSASTVPTADLLGWNVGFCFCLIALLFSFHSTLPAFDTQMLF